MPFSNSSLSTLFYHCMDYTAAVYVFTSFIITKMLLVIPLSIFILYLGHQRWKQQHSFKTANHSDYLTYHLAAMEMISFAAYIVHFCGSYTDYPMTEQTGFYVSNMVLPGEMCFHILTCVERYLAVVHPIIYLELRHSRGVWIRNIATGCVWLMCFGWVGVAALYAPELPIVPLFSFLVFSLLVTSVCSLSVVCVLIQPGPGKMDGEKERADQLKQRAFLTVVAILVVLVLWFVGLFVFILLDMSQLFSYSMGCLLMTSGIWCSLPSSLVLPLLFLHRAGKLKCCHPGIHE